MLDTFQARFGLKPSPVYQVKTLNISGGSREGGGGGGGGGG